MDEEYTGGGGADTGTVTQIPTDEDSELSVLLSRSSSNQSETDNVKKNSSFKFNPDDNVLKVGDIESSSATGYFGESLAYTSVGEIADALDTAESNIATQTGYMSILRDKTSQIVYDSQNNQTTVQGLKLGGDDITLTSGYWFGTTGDTGISKSLKTSVDYLYDNLGGGGFDPSTSSILTAEENGDIEYSNGGESGIVTPDLIRSEGNDWTGASGYFDHSSLTDTLSDIAINLYNLNTFINDSTILSGESGYLYYDNSDGLFSTYGFNTDHDVMKSSGYWLGNGTETYSFQSLTDTLDNLNQRLLALEGNV